MSVRWTALTTVAIVVPIVEFFALVISPGLAIYWGLPIWAVFGGIFFTTVVWLAGLWAAPLWTPAQKAAGTLFVAAAYGLFLVLGMATLSEPMFRNTVSIGGVPSGVILFAIALVGMAVGWLWLRRAVEVEPDTHSFRASQDRSDRWLKAGLVAVGALLVLAAFLQRPIYF
jgi:hypothetical protein